MHWECFSLHQRWRSSWVIIQLASGTGSHETSLCIHLSFVFCFFYRIHWIFLFVYFSPTLAFSSVCKDVNIHTYQGDLKYWFPEGIWFLSLQCRPAAPEYSTGVSMWGCHRYHCAVEGLFPFARSGPLFFARGFAGVMHLEMWKQGPGWDLNQQTSILHDNTSCSVFCPSTHVWGSVWSRAVRGITLPLASRSSGKPEPASAPQLLRSSWGELGLTWRMTYQGDRVSHCEICANFYLRFLLLPLRVKKVFCVYVRFCILRQL